MEYYEWVSRINGVRREGVYRRAIPGSVRGDEIFSVPLRAWRFTTDLDLGLRHVSDDDFEPITVEQARERLAHLVPALDPDEILARAAGQASG